MVTSEPVANVINASHVASGRIASSTLSTSASTDVRFILQLVVGGVVWSLPTVA